MTVMLTLNQDTPRHMLGALLLDEGCLSVSFKGALYSPWRSSEIMAKHSLFQIITVT